MSTYKTNWLPTDTYDVKVDFVRIFNNAVAITNIAQVYVDLWSTVALSTWDENMQKVWGPVSSSPASALKLTWEYSDMIKEEYFATLIGILNYTAYRVFGDTKHMIPISGIKFNSALLNRIEGLERDLNDEIHKK